MSEVKHTPGPWITFQPRGDGSIPVRTDGLGLTICYVHDGAVCDARANARLIAAAPELLEALRALDDAFVSRHGCFPLDEVTPEQRVWKSAMMGARAAIAKAEGRS